MAVTHGSLRLFFQSAGSRLHRPRSLFEFDSMLLAPKRRLHAVNVMGLKRVRPLGNSRDGQTSGLSCFAVGAPQQGNCIGFVHAFQFNALKRKCKPVLHVERI